LGTPVSSTNKTDRQDIAEILSKWSGVNIPALLILIDFNRHSFSQILDYIEKNLLGFKESVLLRTH
jgi:hypothetical protein